MKKFLIWVSVAVVLFAGIFAAIDMAKLSPTYDAQNAAVPVYMLQKNPESYNDSVADGAAAAIVQQNLSETHAVNDVTSIVFDFRGYDTMGESFIMILTVSAVSVLVAKSVKKGKEDKNGEE